MTRKINEAMCEQHCPRRQRERLLGLIDTAYVLDNTHLVHRSDLREVTPEHVASGRVPIGGSKRRDDDGQWIIREEYFDLKQNRRIVCEKKFTA